MILRGETLVINLNRRAVQACRFDMRGGSPALSIGLAAGGCDRHFVVCRGRIMWCERFERDKVESPYDPPLELKVLAAMILLERRTAEALADPIDELFYDVGRIATRLVQRGLAALEAVSKVEIPFVGAL